MVNSVSYYFFAFSQVVFLQFCACVSSGRREFDNQWPSRMYICEERYVQTNYVCIILYTQPFKQQRVLVEHVIGCLVEFRAIHICIDIYVHIYMQMDSSMGPLNPLVDPYLHIPRALNTGHPYLHISFASSGIRLGHFGCVSPQSRCSSGV